MKENEVFSLEAQEKQSHQFPMLLVKLEWLLRFQEMSLLEDKMGKKNGEGEAREYSPTEADPAHKWRKNLVGHFLASSINPGIGDPHTSLAGARKPGYCSHMAFS